MNIDSSHNAGSIAAGGASATSSQDARLRGVCRDVEGVFLSLLMKEGLKGMIEGEDDMSHASGMMENTVEQVANQMASTESLGIAKMLYQEVSGSTSLHKGGPPHA